MAKKQKPIQLDSYHTLEAASSADTFALNDFFGTMYRQHGFWLEDRGCDRRDHPALFTRDRMAQGLGLFANKPIAGMKRISMAAVTLAAISDIPFVRSKHGRILGDFHAYVIKYQGPEKERIVGLMAFEKNPDPMFENRGRDDTRAEVSLWMVPKGLRGAIPLDFTAKVVEAGAAEAKRLGFKTLEAVASDNVDASLALAAKHGFVDTGKRKRADFRPDRRILERRL